MPSKPTYTTSKIVSQLTTSWGGSLTGFTFSWPSSRSTISYAINTSTPTNAAGYTPSEGGANLVAMSTLQVATAAMAFQLWDDLIAKPSGAQHRLVQTTSAAANITLNYSSNTGNSTYSNPFGTVNYATGKVTLSADQIWLSSLWSSNSNSGMSTGGYGLNTMIHEIGHALGLSHPGVYNAGSGATITFANSAVFSQDNRQYTVMSYFGGYLPGYGWVTDGTYTSYIYPQTPMVYDIAAIQALYGADTTTRVGNTVYGFNCNLDAANPEKIIYDFAINHAPIFTIWDAGGTDTLDCSGYSGNQTINLTAGSYSSVDGMIQNVAIAFNCTIENAIGGDGNDLLIGTTGTNQLNGCNGSDIYIIKNASEHKAAEIVDTGTSGSDEVRFTATTANQTLTLFAGDRGIEKVVIGTGTASAAVTTATTALHVNASAVLNALAITGNAGANILTGTAYNDTLAGGNGNDTLTGGNGADTFIFNSQPNATTNHDTVTDFQKGADTLQFSKTVFSAIAGATGATLSAIEFWSGAGLTAGHDTSDRILYDTATGNIYYDADGSGTGSSVLVALIGTTIHPALTNTDISIVA
jgi:Ca2+-binding RTX toxin-like protein